MTSVSRWSSESLVNLSTELYARICFTYSTNSINVLYQLHNTALSNPDPQQDTTIHGPHLKPVELQVRKNRHQSSHSIMQCLRKWVCEDQEVRSSKNLVVHWVAVNPTFRHQSQPKMLFHHFPLHMLPDLLSSSSSLVFLKKFCLQSGVSPSYPFTCFETWHIQRKYLITLERYHQCCLCIFIRMHQYPFPVS